jgi:hypothetical protein
MAPSSRTESGGFSPSKVLAGAALLDTFSGPKKPRKATFWTKKDTFYTPTILFEIPSCLYLGFVRDKKFGQEKGRKSGFLRRCSADKVLK